MTTLAKGFYRRLQRQVPAANPLAAKTPLTLSRRNFVLGLVGGLSALGCYPSAVSASAMSGRVYIGAIEEGEDVIAFVARVKGHYDHSFYKAVIGAANEYKEGDDALGIAAADDRSRALARTLLGNTMISELVDRPMLEDAVYSLIMATTDRGVLDGIRSWTMADLQAFLLDRPETEVKAVMCGLPSDIIGMVVKLMSQAELIQIGQKVFNPLPGSNIGAKGYLGARIQPNSPTDHPDDILWQVLNGFAFAVGDVVLGTNPVASEVVSVHTIERTLQRIVAAFQLTDVLPHCCLAHIDVQAAVEQQYPRSTALWFQSLGSTVDANATFDLSVEKMLRYAAERSGRFGLYFETGQGADATNGHGAGFDMVIHEARKYGFARALKQSTLDTRSEPLASLWHPGCTSTTLPDSLDLRCFAPGSNWYAVAWRIS